MINIISALMFSIFLIFVLIVLINLIIKIINNESLVNTVKDSFFNSSGKELEIKVLNKKIQNQQLIIEKLNTESTSSIDLINNFKIIGCIIIGGLICFTVYSIVSNSGTSSINANITDLRSSVSDLGRSSNELNNNIRELNSSQTTNLNDIAKALNKVISTSVESSTTTILSTLNMKLESNSIVTKHLLMQILEKNEILINTLTVINNDSSIVTGIGAVTAAAAASISPEIVTGTEATVSAANFTNTEELSELPKFISNFLHKK